MIQSDPYFIHRVVGYYEYDKSLQHLDALVAICNTDELDAINDIIAMYDEYAVYVNLSRRAPIEGSILAERRRDTDDRFERRGLNWVMALARVELAAMLAQYTSHPEPFLAYPPSEFDLSAYIEMIEDGTRMHYGSLLKDELFATLPKRAPDEVTLAYARRLLLALRFANAMAQFAEPSYSPEQRQEFAIWKTNLVDWNVGVIGQVKRYIRSIQMTSRVDTSSESRLGSFGTSCSNLCDQITGELEALKGQTLVGPQR